MSNGPRISFDPEPPEQGGKVTICYDFSDLELADTVLLVSFYMNPEPTSYPVSPATACVTIDVPDAAVSLLVEELEGPSPDAATPVVIPDGG